MRALRLVPPILTHRSRGNDRMAACDWSGSMRSNMIVSERSAMSLPSVSKAPASGEWGSMQAGVSEPTRRKFWALTSPLRSRVVWVGCGAADDDDAARAGAVVVEVVLAGRLAWIGTRRVVASVWLVNQMSPAA